MSMIDNRCDCLCGCSARVTWEGDFCAPCEKDSGIHENWFAVRDRARAQVDALEAVEWVADGWGGTWCPWCRGSGNHTADCQRQAALGKKEESK